MIGGGPTLSRRRFLAHGGLAALAGVVAACTSSAPWSVLPRLAPGPAAASGGPFAPVERGPVGHMEPLHAIGHAWFAAHPEDGDAHDLAAALGVTSTADIRSQLSDLAPRIRDDFAAGRTVSLDGWRLAETEVRLATLVWFLEGAPAPA